MPYIQRDSTGKVVALYGPPPSADAEFLPATHPDVLLFLNSGTAEDLDDEEQFLLANLDSKMIRVLEDLLDILIEKRVILFTDLPVDAREKILARKKTRQGLQHLSNLIGGTDEIL